MSSSSIHRAHINDSDSGSDNGKSSRTPLTGDNRVPIRERLNRLQKVLAAQNGTDQPPKISVQQYSEPADDSHLVPPQVPSSLSPGIPTPRDSSLGKASLPPSPQPQTPTAEVEEPECPGAPKKGKIPQLWRTDSSNSIALERMVNEVAAYEVSHQRPSSATSTSSGRRTPLTPLRVSWGPNDPSTWILPADADEEDPKFKEFCAKLATQHDQSSDH
ncbi:hypothetical protein F5Y18DRAFT_426220 [Xylariaceae sp. FL1019]|nr:hypothetical protein F5Y18DRAFT_426220 [Xylariaceae sp. FL1019]